MAIFDLHKLFQDTFGYKPQEKYYKITSDDITIKKNTQKYYAVDVMGREIFMPTYIKL